MILLLLFFLTGCLAYLEETFEITVTPEDLGIADECTYFADHNHTYIRFHNGTQIQTNYMSSIFAINNQCDLVVFGYPNENKVILWRPQQDSFTEIVPNQPEEVFVDRFGFSVDVQNQSWVVGAPGTPNSDENNYKGATLGYAFVYQGNDLQSCRSLYDTFCYPLGTECKLANFKNTKDYYKFLRNEPRYQDVFRNDDPLVQITDEEMARFMKICIIPQQPYYSFGPLDPVRVPYFETQQFGYSVALSGALYEWGTSLYVSAPGDTNRFMEDNDGSNYGRVYMWDANLWQPQDESVDLINWWEFSIFSPIIPPNLRGATYRAFGRDIAASRGTLAVSTYPLYENTREPFVIVYNCNSGTDTRSHCEESPDRGISISDLPGNALNYVSNSMLAYTDGKTRWDYIPSDVPADLLPDFQNDFIGKHIGVTGSNVIVPDHHNKKAYRFGADSQLRETHDYLQNTNFATNSEHWMTQTHKKLTHMWPCPKGTVSAKQLCNYGDQTCVTRKCIPCELQYYSDDGWLDICDLCPINYTTYQEGKSECELFVPPIIPGLSWSSTRGIMMAILGGSVAIFLLIVAWQYGCISKRKKRAFVDKKIIV
jgi:hypothetical protein